MTDLAITIMMLLAFLSGIITTLLWKAQND